ncbi:hypothetical protein [uncultured Clostridium sp.]|jgi:hypothetical protein|uniref:hypothetical protein n=1 Tax=uncultured Clostridium sp. TaxID=59620 RepID=UPI002635CB64|nr:hypothetical protein [uncultured Clostridium sp.]
MLIKINSYASDYTTINLLLLNDTNTAPIVITGLTNDDFTDMLYIEKSTAGTRAPLVISSYALVGDGSTGELLITLSAAFLPTDIIYIKQGSLVKATPLSGIINTASIDETLKGDGTTATTPTKMLAGIGTDQAGTGHKLTIRLMSADGTAISSEEVTLANSFMINDTKVAYINLITDITGPITSDGLFDFTVTYYNAANEELILLNSSTAALTAYLTRA